MNTIQATCSPLDKIIISKTDALTMHAEHNTKLLNPRRCECPRSHGDLFLLQVLDNLLNPGGIFRVFGVVGLVPLCDLFFNELAIQQKDPVKSLYTP